MILHTHPLSMPTSRYIIFLVRIVGNSNGVLRDKPKSAIMRSCYFEFETTEARDRFNRLLKEFGVNTHIVAADDLPVAFGVANKANFHLHALLTEGQLEALRDIDEEPGCLWDDDYHEAATDLEIS